MAHFAALLTPMIVVMCSRQSFQSERPLPFVIARHTVSLPKFDPRSVRGEKDIMENQVMLRSPTHRDCCPGRVLIVGM